LEGLKPIVGIVCTILGGAAGTVFLRSHLDADGLPQIVGSILLGGICIAGMIWSIADRPVA
jgi:hypothetical protein